MGQTMQLRLGDYKLKENETDNWQDLWRVMSTKNAQLNTNKLVRNDEEHVHKHMSR